METVSEISAGLLQRLRILVEGVSDFPRTETSGWTVLLSTVYGRSANDR